MNEPNFRMIASLVRQTAAPLQELAEVTAIDDQPAQSSLTFSQVRSLGQDLTQLFFGGLGLVLKQCSPRRGQSHQQVGFRVMTGRSFQPLFAPEEQLRRLQAQQLIDVAAATHHLREEIRSRFRHSASHLQQVSERLVGI